MYVPSPVSRFSSPDLQHISQTALAYARVWHHVDASDRILGKLAERIALVLMGKHKPIFDAAGSLHCSWTHTTCFIYLFEADCGDYVVVTNAKRVKVSGRKDEQVLYRKHTMYPGGLKEIKYKEMMQRKPDEVRNTLACYKPAAHLRIFCHRSFDRQFQGCCQKTNYGRGD